MDARDSGGAGTDGETGELTPRPPAAADATRIPPAPDAEPAPEEPPAPDEESGPVDTRPKRRWPRTLRRTALALVLLLLLPTLAAETALRLDYTGTPGRGTHTRNRDAIWLGHAWIDGRKTDADVTALVGRLRDTGIRDLYVHAGPLEHDGTLPESAYPRARWLTETLRRRAPHIRVQAWLGDEVAPEKPYAMHLERPATRSAVVESTRRILDAGFEGAHFDLEPLHSGDRDYLALLDALHRVTRARHAVLSVAAHQIDPLPAFHSFWGTVTGHPKWWSQAYFGQVARRVDQIAVMSYDTMQPLQSLYGGYVAQQTSLALEVTPESTDLLMGLPFYHENRFGHWARAETVPAAVRGVRLGLSRTDRDRARFGVALYVDFAATEADWAAYREDWAR
ncbi:glycosyl hydrolase family 18 protein [Streptomyces barringtoniae]|uniref:glycosyl hydrolase family 18 protein n=1 Tax=Streptomyces barringtoniae TaxID=2892029 RepID=UPI001E2EFC7B|nr:glycosyl hydrolase family 18 protein [Streptomyces barringtoniae]MCC5480727.1 glycoside hydrolase family 18 protein [Streptomyces barringtoniae]